MTVKFSEWPFSWSNHCLRRQRMIRAVYRQQLSVLIVRFLMLCGFLMFCGIGTPADGFLKFHSFFFSLISAHQR